MKTYRINKPKIVVIGGGTGLPVILKGLKNESADITAIVTVADDGGSSGELVRNISMAPPGDLRNVLVSLSAMPRLYEDIFQYRFKKTDGFIGNHTVGNLIIAALSEMRGSTYEAIQLLAKMLQVEGHIYPASEEILTLHAQFTDGSIVSGESKIALEGKEIDHVFVTNTHNNEKPKAARKVIRAIEDADMIVLGPGSLYTSILPNLMIEDIGKAVVSSSAEVVYICNIMTQKGETEHFTDADHIKVLHKHLGTRFIDTVLVNIAPVPETAMDFEKYDEYLLQVAHDREGLAEEHVHVIADNFLELRDQGVFHNGKKVIEELFQIVLKGKY